MPGSTKVTEIIIVKYGLPELEAECIQQVSRTVKSPYHLTVYDNYIPDEPLSMVWNKLIERSNADYICLLNNDTIPQGNWLEKMLEVFQKGHTYEIGAVGPITNNCGTHQSGFQRDQVRDDVWECDTLSGFCLLFPWKIWQKIGGFNEKYRLYGEDSEFVSEIKRLGYALLTHYGSYVYHHGAQSTDIAKRRGKDIDAIRKESSQIFAEYKKRTNR